MIRKANEKDIKRIMEIYDISRKYMYANGNPTQWKNGYPSIDILSDDINHGNCHVLCKENDELDIYAVFTLIIGEDATYRKIENGRWINDYEYGTIHRMASDGSRKGIFDEVIKYSFGIINNIRIDTHKDNMSMQHLAEKNGFEKCGIIYVADGSPRIAYQKYTG